MSACGWLVVPATQTHSGAFESVESVESGLVLLLKVFDARYRALDTDSTRLSHGEFGTSFASVAPIRTSVVMANVTVKI